ncbi:hypothetical protein [Siccirubricoccus sp. G192]|uniref:hypothetical protein n=1 Tax=Siccirubricoccus sp. G192 TaxID=2849651 RepID=UPI001C2B8EC2|nr:hypothetical protein [Siccirubricoccus sp. G192]MBV1797141.1 hypothetical protein [Siccirubricoccus sp. G192]
MRTGQKIRHYLALSARGELLAACERDLAAAEDDLRNMLRAAAKGPLPLRFKVVSRVVLGAPFAASVRREPGADTEAKRIVLSLEFDDTGTVEAFREALAGYLEQRPDAGPHAGPQGKPFGLGVDLPIAAADCWCPGEAAAPLFGTRRAALALIGEPALGPLRGQGVNVVVVDQGVDLGRLPAARRGGAWRKEDGKWRFEDRRSAMPAPLAGTRNADPRRSHGTMVARNVLAVAPEARIFDLPLLPPEIGNQRAFLKDAQLAAAAVYEDIDRLRSAGRASERWVIVNAWGGL